YTWFKPDLGKFENLRHHSTRRVQIAALAGAVIGFYDGIFGPGTGSFLMLILVASLGYAFITASAIAKVVNVATNVGAILVFGIHGAVIWQIGIIMGAANITGAVAGSRLAIKGGSTLVRKVFLIVTIALIIKVGIATF
ncbi:MAG: TSUP family transporter, partial [Acidobacteriota bacterium]|nr:TSUP family transporter [Acidobacteriota bacterium]